MKLDRVVNLEVVLMGRPCESQQGDRPAGGESPVGRIRHYGDSDSDESPVGGIRHYGDYDGDESPIAFGGVQSDDDSDGDESPVAGYGSGEPYHMWLMIGDLYYEVFADPEAEWNAAAVCSLPSGDATDSKSLFTLSGLSHQDMVNWTHDWLRIHPKPAEAPGADSQTYVQDFVKRWQPEGWDGELPQRQSPYSSFVSLTRFKTQERSENRDGEVAQIIQVSPTEKDIRRFQNVDLGEVMDLEVFFLERGCGFMHDDDLSDWTGTGRWTNWEHEIFHHWLCIGGLHYEILGTGGGVDWNAVTVSRVPGGQPTGGKHLFTLPCSRKLSHQDMLNWTHDWLRTHPRYLVSKVDCQSYVRAFVKRWCPDAYRKLPMRQGPDRCFSSPIQFSTSQTVLDELRDRFGRAAQVIKIQVTPTAEEEQKEEDLLKRLADQAHAAHIADAHCRI